HYICVFSLKFHQPPLSPLFPYTTLFRSTLSPEGEGSISRVFKGCQDLVRFFALLRIKPHAPPLVRVPVNSFEFQPCGRTPQAERSEERRVGKECSTRRAPAHGKEMSTRE